MDLYDPTRSRNFVQKGKPAEHADFDAYIEKLRGQLQGDGGAGLAFLVEEVHSPTRERLRAQLEGTYSGMRWCVYDAASSDAAQAATQTAFGQNTHLLPRLDRADVILALDSDFLDCGEGDIAAVRAFTEKRRLKEAKDTMNRLYVVENRFSLTGSMADHRLRVSGESDSGFHFRARAQNRRRHHGCRLVCHSYNGAAV